MGTVVLLRCDKMVLSHNHVFVTILRHAWYKWLMEVETGLHRREQEDTALQIWAHNLQSKVQKLKMYLLALLNYSATKHVISI